MLTAELKKSVESLLSAKKNSVVQILESTGLGGGCINKAFALKTNVGKYFIKFNSAAAYPGMFEKEAAGLKILKETGTIAIPEVIGFGASENYTFLLLHYIESGPEGRNFWTEFGTGLADLHRNSSEYFGLDHDNYIGSLAQSNRKHSGFYSFFISERIEPQLRNLRNKGAFSHNDTRYFDSLFNSLHNIIPLEKPALIHGDLWSGNFMIASDGSPCLVDPAVYYGHREADIAMSRLFGGFHPEFYHAYNHAWPLEKDWEKRTDIFNLYPLLVHASMFGGSYAGQVLRIIRQF